MGDSNNLFRTVEDYGLWMTLCVCVINFSASILVVASNNPVKGVFQGFQIVALIAALLAIILTLKKTRRPDYFESAETIAGNVICYMIAVTSASFSLGWINSF